MDKLVERRGGGIAARAFSVLLSLALVLGCCGVPASAFASAAGSGTDGVQPNATAYTGTFYYNYDGAPSDGVYTTVAADENGSVTMPQAPSRTDFGFMGWYADATCSGDALTWPQTITQDTSYYAKWAQNAFTVRYHLNYEGATPDPYATKEHVQAQNQAKPSENPMREGFVFVGWYTDSSCTGDAYAFSNTNLDADVDLYAKWATNPWAIGDVTYSTFSEAQAAATSGSTITLLYDLPEELASLTVGTATDSYTIDLASHTLAGVEVNTPASVDLTSSTGRGTLTGTSIGATFTGVWVKNASKSKMSHVDVRISLEKNQNSDVCGVYVSSVGAFKKQVANSLDMSDCSVDVTVIDDPDDPNRNSALQLYGVTSGRKASVTMTGCTVSVSYTPSKVDDDSAVSAGIALMTENTYATSSVKDTSATGNLLAGIGKGCGLYVYRSDISLSGECAFSGTTTDVCFPKASTTPLVKLDADFAVQDELTVLYDSENVFASVAEGVSNTDAALLAAKFVPADSSADAYKSKAAVYSSADRSIKWGDSIASATVDPIDAVTYDGTAKEPKPVVKMGETTLVEGTDYVLSYRDNVDAAAADAESGAPTVVITGMGDYGGTLEATFTIKAADLSGATIDKIADQTATGKAVEPKPVVKLGGKTLVEGTDYTVSYKDNTAAGTATVTVTGTGNYSGSASANFTIKAAGADAWKRLAGNTAIGTMKQIVNEGWSTSDWAIVATTNGYYDALSASGLAGLLDCPILMTAPDKLTDATSKLITSKKVKNVIVVGGVSAVSANVFDQIKKLGVSVERVAGNTAIGTANKIYERGKKVKGGWGSDAVVATSSTYQDALSIAPYAYAKKAPVFLAKGKPGTLADSTANAIKKGGFTRTIIVGGTSAVASSVDKQVVNSKRLAGNTAYGTSKKIAEFCLSKEVGMTAAHMGVATGKSYYDALAGAALCGKKNSVLILADDGNSNNVDNVVKVYKGQLQKSCYIFGGTSAVSTPVENKIKAASK